MLVVTINFNFNKNVLHTSLFLFKFYFVSSGNYVPISLLFGKTRNFSLEIMNV